LLIGFSNLRASSGLNGKACLPCPAHASCAGGVDPPRNDPGWCVCVFVSCAGGVDPPRYDPGWCVYVCACVCVSCAGGVDPPRHDPGWCVDIAFKYNE